MGEENSLARNALAIEEEVEDDELRQTRTQG